MKKETGEKLGDEIRGILNRWEDIRVNGGADPFWEDGCNMNLLRNHVISAKRRCEEELTPDKYPPDYYVELPPEVDTKYMAREQEIRENAEKSLKAYMDDPDFLYLEKAVTRLTERERSSLHIENVLAYPNGLARAISNGDLVSMRRHEHPERYIDSFRSCRKKVEAILSESGNDKPLPQGQLTLFDIFDMA